MAYSNTMSLIEMGSVKNKLKKNSGVLDKLKNLNSEEKIARSAEADKLIQQLTRMVEEKESFFNDQQNKLTSALERLASSGDKQLDLSPVMAMIEQQNKMMQSNALMLTKLIGQIQSTPASATSVEVVNNPQAYRFEIQRDNRGRISDMIATPVSS